MNKNIGYMVLGIIVLAGTFYAGMTYGGNNVRAAILSRGTTFGQNSMMRGNRNIGSFTVGQIIAKDTNSITVQLTTGGPGGTTTSGSKIVFIDSNTKVTKSVTGTLTDLAVGTEVSVTGTPNADGSENAESVQIRPTPIINK